MDNNQTNEKKKSNVGLIIIIIIVILLLLFAVWFFLLRDKGTNNTGNGGNNNTQQEEKKDDKPTTPTNSTEKREYDYSLGVLNQIVDEEGKPEQTDFVINGMVIVGKNHTYNGNSNFEENVDYFVKQGFKKSGINASFYAGEWFDIYMDSTYNGQSSDIKYFISKHKPIEEYSEINNSNLEKYALGGKIGDYDTPDKSDNNFFAEEGTSNGDETGQYDLIFVYKGKIAYFMVFEITNNPNE